jgi:hypothetical protein
MEMTTRMMRINRKLALAASLTAIVVGVGTGVAFAAAEESGGDNISPANTSTTATNSGNITFKGTVSGLSVTVTCKNSSISGTTPASGLGPANVNNPSFTNCSDNVFGNDTVTTNSTNGHWQVTFVDAANDEGLVIGSTTDEPAGHGSHSGDQIKITIPKAGAKFVAAGGFCTITVAPSGAVTIIGSYNDAGTLTFSSQSIPVSGSGCTATSSSMSGIYTFSPIIQDVS